MANKVIIGILVLLVIFVGGVGYYSYTLNRQIDDLSGQLAAFETEQTARINAVSDELRNEITTGLGSLENRLEESQADIAALGSELEDAADRISGVEEEIGGVSTRITDLDERISSAEEDIARSVINTSEVYEKISPAVVRITDGQNTLGSGFIYDTGGHVITAHHVVAEMDEIIVMMHDGRISKATVIGECQTSDVAVLKLEDNPGIAPLPIGDSSLVKIGEPVIAIGSPGDGENPLGLKDTLTSGIISNVNLYTSYGPGDYMVANLFQFDAAVNFGNSGGPLLNTAGEVIGLIVARIDPAVGDGINWAVASNKVKRVADAIIADGSFAYPWVGVGIDDITPDMVQDMSLETSNGVLVTYVYLGSPAEVAGFQTGDIIVAIGGVPVKDTGELTSYLGEYESPGDTTVIEVMRGATSLKLTVEIGTR
jgi:2-alkenal reductase